MDFLGLFIDVFNTIKDFVLKIIDILLFIPNFIIDTLSIFPTEIQVLFGSVLSIICIALVYRFIK